MTQQVVHARTTFFSTASPTDNATTDFYFEATGADVNLDFAAATSPLTVLKAFWNVPDPGMGLSIASTISEDYDRSTNAVLTEWTDVTAHLDGSPAGSPFRMDNWTLAANGHTAGLPAGVAVCVGYRRDYGSDVEHLAGTRPRARDRGRFYIPSIDTGFMSHPGGRPLTPWLNAVANQFNGLAGTQNLGDANQFNLVQWSRKNASVGPVRWYFVDENFCYQRRRADTTANRVHGWIAV